MAKEHFNQLKADVGLVNMLECTTQENSVFAEMEKNGQALPEDVCRAEYNDIHGQPVYYRLLAKAPSDKEELYVLMRISKDLHFIKVLFQVLLVLSIIAIVLNIFIS